MGNFGCPAQCGTYRGVFVERDADALSASTDGDSGIDVTLFEAFGQCVCIIGIVARGFVVSSVIFIRKPFFIEILLDKLFECKAGVVAG